MASDVCHTMNRRIRCDANPMRLTRPACLLIAWLPVLTSCAVKPAGSPAAQTQRPPQGHAHKLVAWPLSELVQAEGRRVVLADDEKPVALVELAYLKAAWSATQRLLAEVPEAAKPTVLITQGQTPNALAFHHAGHPHVGINLGMLALLGADEPALAALIGHEIAHLQQNHQQIRDTRKTTTQTASNLIGMALVVAGLPLGDVVADSAATLVERGYTRDEEREADRLGLEMMRRAGYDPTGAVRLHEKLAASGGGAALPFLSTHPGSQERAATMRALAREAEAAVPPAPSPSDAETPGPR